MKRVLTTKMILWLALATATVVLMASSSPQCARSGDRADVSLNPLAPDPVKACERDCKADARVATRDERKRHRLASKACNGDAVCHAEEDALHAAIVAEIEADELACIEACQHQQGSGIGGQ